MKKPRAKKAKDDYHSTYWFGQGLCVGLLIAAFEALIKLFESWH